MSVFASQITGVSIVYWTICSGADQRIHQSSASLAFVKRSTVAGEFPAQMANNAEKVSTWWRHHAMSENDTYMNDYKLTWPEKENTPWMTRVSYVTSISNYMSVFKDMSIPWLMRCFLFHTASCWYEFRFQYQIRNDKNDRKMKCVYK